MYMMRTIFVAEDSPAELLIHVREKEVIRSHTLGENALNRRLVTDGSAEMPFGLDGDDTGGSGARGYFIA